MIVHGHRENFLGGFLPDHMLIEFMPDLGRFWHPQRRRLPAGIFVQLFVEDAFADVDAVVADIDAWAGDQLANFCVALSAERAHRQIRGPSHTTY